MKRRRPLAPVAAAVALLLVPAAADAGALPLAPALHSRITRVGDELALLARESGSGAPQPEFAVSELRFTNRDGFRIGVVAYGQTVALSVSNRHRPRLDAAVRRSSNTTYLAHGKVTPTSIEASFGDRGRIAVRFRSSGRELRATRRAGCGRPSNRVVARLGVFSGALRFRGEGGYTSAMVSRARGGVIDFDALARCLAGAAPPPRPAMFSVQETPTHPSRRPKLTTFTAGRKLPVAWTLFGVRVREDGDPRFVAVDLSVEGRLGIARFVSARGSRSSFAFEDSLAAASVSPPVPFSGEGIFRHDAGGAKTWSGSLAVSFLGAPRVPIAAAPFSTRLVQSW